jgi:adenine-specific DNA-methyltransferase
MSKYDHLTKNELIALLEKRDRSRKLGLVWERNELEAESSLNDDFVVMNLHPELSCGQAPYNNLLIEGDNFDALRYLRIAFKGRIKCIYIDPPYNTENKDFIYNDRFVDEEDSYRHSKWLEHLHQRLHIAAELLSDDGVMLVSINDENCAKLDLLLNQIMPNRRLGSFVWRTKDTGNDRGGNLSQVHEHILVYAREKFEFRGNPLNTSNYRNSDEDLRGAWRSQPITCNKSFKERENLYYPIQNPVTGLWYPCDPDSTWRYASEKLVKVGQKLRAETIEQLIAQDEIYFPDCAETDVFFYASMDELRAAIASGDVPILPQKKTPLLRQDLPELTFWVGKRIASGRPSRKHFLERKEKLISPLSSWIAGLNETIDYDLDFADEIAMIRSPRGREGSDSIKNIMGSKAFDYPKPPTLIKHLVDQSTTPHDIVLDFYAGSGTTGHSVLQLNQEDGGKRKFILISSTEKTASEPDKNVCRDVCAQRLSRVIQGYAVGKQQIAGLGGSFAYLTAVRVAQRTLQTDIQHDQVWYALQLLTFEAVEPFDAAKDLHCVETANSRILYLPHSTSEIIRVAQQAVESDQKATTIYTWQSNAVMQHIQHAHVSVEQIPDYLIERFGGKQI